MDRLDAVFAGLVSAAHSRGVGDSHGYQSTAAWLRWQAGMRTGEVRAAIDAGALAEVLPETIVGWRNGEITTGAMRTIAGARVDGFDTELQAVEPEFLDAARRKDLWSLQRMTALFRACAKRDGDLPSDRSGLRAAIVGDRLVLDGEIGGLADEPTRRRWPGCEKPPGWCEAHHVQYWENGGASDLANGVLLCSRHHRFLHQHPDWQIEWDQTTFRVYRPDGTELAPWTENWEDHWHDTSDHTDPAAFRAYQPDPGELPGTNN